MTLGEDLVLGLQTLALGMVVTFAGLLILQGVMLLMAKFSKASGNNGRPPNASAVSDPAPSKDATPVAVEGPATQPGRLGQPDEEIAAISAVMAVLTAEGGAAMQVRSVKPMGPGAAAASNTWGLAGRQEIMAARRRA